MGNLGNIKAIILIIFVALGIYFVRVRTTGDTADTYWHLAVGRELWQQKQIPKTDNFVYGKAETHYTSTEWLSGLGFYLPVKYLGLESLVAIRLICGLGAIFFLYKTIAIFTKDLLKQISILLATGYVLAIRLFDRPENFSILFVAAINYVCLKYFFKNKFDKLFFLLPLIFLTWPNIHAFVVYGFALFSFWIFIFLYEEARKIRLRQNIKTVLTLYAISTLVIILQAKRFFFFLELGKLTSFSVNEWGSLADRVFLSKGYQFFSQMPVEVYFYFLFAVTTTALVFISLVKKEIKTLSLVLAVAVYLVIFLLPFKYYRLIPLAVLTLAPITAYFFSKVENQWASVTTKIAVAIITVLMLGSILVGYTIGSKSYFKSSFDESGKTIGVKSRLWGQVFPEKTSEMVGQYLTTRNLFTFDWWSNYFIWQNPTIKTYSDVMYQYRTQEDFKEEQIIASGQEGWDKLVEKYDIDTVVNSQFAAPKGSSTPVWKLPNWKLIYVDNVSALWARDDVIKTLPVDLSALNLELEEPLKFKPENKEKAVKQLENLIKFHPKNDFARGQLIQNYIDEGKLEDAKKLAQESRTLMPKDPTFAMYLAAVYSSEGNCQMASQFAKESLRKSYSDYNFRALESIVLSGCQN